MQEVLYRFFDSKNTLLYVGISNNWLARLKHHESFADFYAAVDRMTIERFPNRKSVVTAEKKAIKEENPLFNRAENPNYRTWQTHFRELIDMCKKKVPLDQQHDELIRRLQQSSEWYETYGTADWFVGEFPPEWYELNRQGRLDCDLCEELARHDTVHAWREMGDEE